MNKPLSTLLLFFSLHANGAVQEAPQEIPEMQQAPQEIAINKGVIIGGCSQDLHSVDFTLPIYINVPKELAEAFKQRILLAVTESYRELDSMFENLVVLMTLDDVRQVLEMTPQEMEKSQNLLANFMAQYLPLYLKALDSKIKNVFPGAYVGFFPKELRLKWSREPAQFCRLNMPEPEISI